MSLYVDFMGTFDTLILRNNSILRLIILELYLKKREL